MTKEEKDKQFVKTVDEMTAQILMHLNTMISDEECDYYIEVTGENATEFFTALNNAICHKMRKTGMADNFLKAQHVYNELLVQYLLKSHAEVVEDQP